MRSALIVFDLDGTLFDTMSVDALAFNRALAEFSAPPVTVEKLRTLNGLTIENMIAKLGLDRSQGAAFDAALVRHEHALMETHGRLYAGVPEMLEKLAMRATLAIATSGSGEYMNMVAAQYGFGRYMSIMLGDDGSGTSDKADKVRRIAEAIPHDKLIMVGDRESDINAGIASGGRTIGVLYGFGGEAELSHAHALAQDVVELSDTMERWLTEGWLISG